MATDRIVHKPDVYPSRIKRNPDVIPRQDLVVRGTAEDGPLTQEQLDAFERDGFVLIDELLTSEEVERIWQAVEEMASDPRRLHSPTTIIEPRSESVRSLFAVHEEPGVFAELAAHDKVAGAARQILGTSVYIHQSRVNLKPGFEGAGFPWHSDFETWHIEDGMPRMHALSFSIALTENSDFNGPLLLVPESHRQFVACIGATPEDHYKSSLRWQEYGTPDKATLAEFIKERGLVAAKGKPGSAVIFDCNTMHGSSDNITPYSRSNIFMVYNSMENTLTEPYGGMKPRPDFVASRSFTPVG